MRLLVSMMLAVAILSGCSNFSTMQTARTLPVGTFRFALGGGAFTSNQLSSVVTSSTTTTQSLTFPYLEVGGRLGVATHFDLGARYTVPGSIAADAKYQFIEDSTFALAIGFQAAYVPISVNSSTSNLLDLAIPLYLSADFADWIGLYASGRYLQRFQFGATSSSTPFYSTGVGLRLGNTAGLMAEVTCVRQGSSAFRGIQFGAALFFGSAPSAGYKLGREGRVNKWGPKADALLEDPKKRQPSQVLEILERGKSMRVSHDDLRLWKEGEFLCAVNDRGQEMGCGNVVSVTTDGATVLLSRRKGGVLPGLEVVLRP